MFYMLYVKDSTRDKTFKCFNPDTACYVDRLVYAPRWTVEQLDALKGYVDEVRESPVGKFIQLQIRVAGTGKAVY